MDVRSAEFTTSPTLLIRLRDGDDLRAWELFVEIYSPVIFSYCRRRNLQDSDAADVCQEVFLTLSNALPNFQYRTEKGKFRHWLGLIIRRELIRYWKRQGRSWTPVTSHSLDDTEDSRDWDEHCYAALFVQAQSRIRPSFEEETWAMFDALWNIGQSARQVAEQYNVSIQRVYEAKSRVLKRLKAEVETLCEDWPLLAPNEM